ncbi:hypothetical protein DM01DRAFT_1405637 [Hesseltinella vesiculosa]|uniref:RAVE subunit 2/Rogdi n=1 Tax=Hesseltinella vesiculosa TaxID=101127 RepID=A0A1X2GNG7_9FUNG|nr:hypothetical protein DM01DRAFT_1405637 [Hesseltinella vesiculosa]
MQLSTCKDAQAITNQQTWLLASVLPSVLGELETHLETCLTLFTDTKLDALPLSSTQNESIKGYINFSGTTIQKADIQVRLGNAHWDTSVRAMIQPTTPYFLEQAQQCKNYLQLAFNKVKKHQGLNSKHHAIQFFDAMCQLMDCALHALDYPNESSLFPYKVCHPKFFTPPLKQDLIIEFCISDVYLICNVFGLDQSTNSIKWDHRHHHHVTYKDKVMEVLDEARAQTQSPMLTGLKANLTTIADLCLTFKQSLLQA